LSLNIDFSGDDRVRAEAAKRTGCPDVSAPPEVDIMNILKALLLALFLLLPFGCDNISAPGGSTVPAYDDPESPEYIPPTEIP